MSNGFFPPRPAAVPKIYAYEDTNPQYKGLLKIGSTTKDVRERVQAHSPTLRPGEPPDRIVLEESAMRNDGSVFTDHDVPRTLRARGIPNVQGEWFRWSVEEVRAAILAIQRRWESALLVNVDNDTLARLFANPQAMAALERLN